MQRQVQAGFTLVEIMIVVLIIGIISTVALPAYRKAAQAAQRNTCINNLRILQNGIEAWAMETKKVNGTAVNQSELLDYLKAGIPTCPGGGTYTIGNVGEDPTCSLAADLNHTF